MRRITKAVVDRAEHAIAVWGNGPWRLWAAAVWFIYGAFVVWRDELSDPTKIEQFRVVKMIPHLPLAWWIVVTLSVLLVGLFEASYRMRHGCSMDTPTLEHLELKRREIAAQEAHTAAIREQVEQQRRDNDPWRQMLLESQRAALRKKSSPLQIIFENQELGSREGTVRYSVIINNRTSGQTVSDVCLRIVKPFPSRSIIACALGPNYRDGKADLFKCEVLHPGQCEIVNLFGIPAADLVGCSDDVVGTACQFELELIGRDVPAVRAKFEYDPSKAFKLHRVS